MSHPAPCPQRSIHVARFEPHQIGAGNDSTWAPAVLLRRKRIG
jgi:hypothetical protein